MEIARLLTLDSQQWIVGTTVRISPELWQTLYSYQYSEFMAPT